MTFRKAKHEELDCIFLMGYDVWSDGLQEDAYLKICHDSKKYKQGTWWVYGGDVIVSSLITYNLGGGRSGVGSIATVPGERKKGHGSSILNCAVDSLFEQSDEIFLFSDIETSFYKKHGFHELPEEFQQYKESRCMYLLKSGEKLSFKSDFTPPSYF